ncbi:hypothetical protein ACHAWF_014753 [Thalassiosira exigua]
MSIMNWVLPSLFAIVATLLPSGTWLDAVPVPVGAFTPCSSCGPFTQRNNKLHGGGGQLKSDVHSWDHLSRQHRIATLCGTAGNSGAGDAEGNVTGTSVSAPAKSATASPITVTAVRSSPASKSKPHDDAQTSKTERVNPVTLRFNNRLNRLAKRFDATTAPKVEALLLEAVENYAMAEDAGEFDLATTEDVITPNTVSFTNAITAWARCTRKDSAKRAQALLDRMRSLHDERGWDHVAPNTISYNSAITAWARSRERGSASRAESLLREMYELHDAKGGEGEGEDGRAEGTGTGNGSDRLKPNARSWNAVINAVARSREEGCADRAKSLLDEMGRRYDEGDDDLLPDALTFGAVINAYANGVEEGASDKAAQLLMHMESLHQLGFERARPTTFVCEWSNHFAVVVMRSPCSALIGIDLHLHIVFYQDNACMNAFAKDPLTRNNNGTDDNGDALLNRAEQAEQLLTSMERRYAEEGDHRIMPDCISYATVVNAYANCRDPRSGTRADVVLRRMTHRFLLGDTKCRPNAVAYTAAIKAHAAAIDATSASSGEVGSEGRATMEASARRCEDLLHQLCLLHQGHGGDRSLKPTAVTFDLTTKALARVEDWEGVERLKLLRSGF